jgi:hypothetical protein
MHRRIGSLVSVRLATFLLFALGCSEPHPSVDSSRVDTKVKGIVKLRGKPAQGGGEVSFNPANVERKVGAIRATIESDGSYALTTYTGQNEVMFYGPFLKGDARLGIVGRSCDVQPGENTFDFDLGGPSDQIGTMMYPREKK